jgi:hypothetical protein
MGAANDLLRAFMTPSRAWGNPAILHHGNQCQRTAAPLEQREATKTRQWGAANSRRERLQGKAPGAQEARHILKIGELPSTAQRRHAAAQ